MSKATMASEHGYTRSRRIAIAVSYRPRARKGDARGIIVRAARPMRRRAGQWRRIAAGTNRISSVGIWKPGSRREAARADHLRDTDWHRARRATAMHGRCEFDMSA